MPRTRIATFVLCGLCALALVPGAVAIAIHPDDVEISYGEGIAFLVGAVAIASVPLVAALLVSRHVPGNVIGPLLAAEAFVVVATGSTSVYGYAAEGGGLPAFTWVVGSMQGAWMTLFIPFALLVLFFPDGRLPGPRWRVVPVGLAVVFVLFELGAAFTPHSYEEPWQDLDHPHSPMLQFVAMAMLPAFLVLLAACVISIFRRFRRADPVQRHQIRWLQLVSAAVPLALLLSWLTYLLLGDTGVTQVVFVVMLLAMFIAVPIAVTIAVTRHDLYDVDRAVVTATVYAVIGAWLLAVFTAVSAVVGLVAGRASTSLAVVGTAVVALALGSVRARLTRGVGARLYPDRARAIGAVTALQREVNAGTAVPEQLEPVLRAALRDPALRVGYAVPGQEACVDRDGREVPSGPGATPAMMAGHRVGVVVPGVGTPRWLVDDVAEAAALLVEMGRLRLEVSQALQEVEASRSRLVRAGYEERRRLELDLHDGAQQRLVSLGMALRLAQRHLGDGSLDLDEVLDEAVAEIGTAVSELRQIAHGLRPSSLDDGLTAALENLTRNTPLPVMLDLHAEDLPDHVSTTAYYVASEAVANTLKHASAGAIAMSVHRRDGVVRVKVSDDGRGGATIRPGSGLAGLRDRVGAIGGTLGIRSLAGAGTVVEAVLPCES
jgi:signal transduction histidine kinase